MSSDIAEIVDTLSDLDVPVTQTAESGPYTAGINVWRMTRADQPSRTYPYRGVMVQVMYQPQGASETLHEEWISRVRAALLETYPDRYRPMVVGTGMLIQDANTGYTRWRTEENAKRARLGFRPLHEIGQ